MCNRKAPSSVMNIFRTFCWLQATLRQWLGFSKCELNPGTAQQALLKCQPEKLDMAKELEKIIFLERGMHL